MPGGTPPTQPLAARPLTLPDPSRLPPNHPGGADILRVHEAALAAGEPGYVDPGSGLFVLTSQFLADRGWCCTRGCRHCPYVDTRAGADSPALSATARLEADAGAPEPPPGSGRTR